MADGWNYEAIVTAGIRDDQVTILLRKSKFGDESVEVLTTVETAGAIVRTIELNTIVHAKGFAVASEWEIGVSGNGMTLTAEVSPRS